MTTGALPGAKASLLGPEQLGIRENKVEMEVDKRMDRLIKK